MCSYGGQGESWPHAQMWSLTWGDHLRTTSRVYGRPTIDYRPEAVGFRNVLVHDYIEVNDSIVIDRMKSLGGWLTRHARPHRCAHRGGEGLFLPASYTIMPSLLDDARLAPGHPLAFAAVPAGPLSGPAAGRGLGPHDTA